MKKRVMAVVCICLLLMTFAGCGGAGVPDTVETTTICIDKKGGVTYYLAGAFDREYYQLEELTSMAMKEAAEFCRSAGASAVTVEKAELVPEDGDRVVITYRFDSCDTFEGFNGSVLFYGTVGEAKDAGYAVNTVLTNEKGEEIPLNADMDRKVIIMDAKALVYCPSKVTGVSRGAVLKEDGSVDTTAAEGTVSILLKK